MIIGGFLEFILGNTFPFVVFSSFGAFWLTFGSTLQPFYNAYGAYAPAGATSAAAGLDEPAWNASFGKSRCSDCRPWLTDESRIFPTVHGFSLPDILHMLIPYEHCFCYYLFYTRPCFYPVDWCVLATCIGKYNTSWTVDGCKLPFVKPIILAIALLPQIVDLKHLLIYVYLGRWRKRLRNLHGRLVYFLRHSSHSRRFPISDPCR